ncbi:unnamed protein product [Clonostachys chloroleuca]|uniref:Rhodopsin domain-containing protein n=1 Tax=Clonostachys chloroleuca TaxID=1926264 RepID=A0AA35LWM4_9HYPO|nr:unnamed protein product [Clonostachys chloroleuca]
MKDEDTITAVGAAFAILSVLAVIIRFYVQFALKSGAKWDDWLILASLLLMLGIDVLSIYASSMNPTGPTTATVETESHDYSPKDQLYTKFSWTMSMVYFSVSATTKLSIIFMYKRIFDCDAPFRRLIFALAAIVIGFWIGCTVANLLNCIPMRYVWINSLSDPRYCFNYNIFWFASGLAEAVIDILIIILPIKIVLGLHLSIRQKIAVASVFMIGVVVILSGLLKAIFGYLPGSRQPSFFHTQVWTSVHCGTGIVCACLPVCWPLVVRIGKINMRSWAGPSFLRNYWYRLSGWVSTDRGGKQSSGRSGRSREEEEGGFQLTNNFTSRGFDITFSGVDGEQYTKDLERQKY